MGKWFLGLRVSQKKSHNVWKVHKTYPYMIEDTVTR